ncbi:hypothetical protein LCGC14_1819350 [marine sediment metagenome]|uniref:Uncharacterized protein n=1 Tax=marine sediment metagenome TaxID=412755 RepID=A0A0F9IZ72_9ZZZZ
MGSKFDNERDRHAYGYDAGQIIDGEVRKDLDTGHYILVDEDGVGFDPQVALESLAGQTVRLTLISHRSLQRATELMDAVQSSDEPS